MRTRGPIRSALPGFKQPLRSSLGAHDLGAVALGAVDLGALALGAFNVDPLIF